MGEPALNICNVFSSSAGKTTGLPLSVAHIVKSAILASTNNWERTPSDHTSQHNKQQQHTTALFTSGHLNVTKDLVVSARMLLKIRHFLLLSFHCLICCNSGQLELSHITTYLDSQQYCHIHCIIVHNAPFIFFIVLMNMSNFFLFR